MTSNCKSNEQKLKRESRKYVDKITLECLSSNRLSKNDINNGNNNGINNGNNNGINNDKLFVKATDLGFYKRRVLNTTRELIKQITDPSFNETNNIICDRLVKEAFGNYINTLITAYRQDDMRDMIRSHNGFDNDECSGLESILEESQETQSQIQDIQDIQSININQFNISMRKNRYDWSRFCKIEKCAESEANPLNTPPKLGEYNLRDPALKNKGVKSRERVKETLIQNKNVLNTKPT